MSLARHQHDHKNEHGHAHAHADHAGHGHAHAASAHDHASTARRADPGVSLLRMSSAQRLAVAGVLVAAIWLGVFWAWSGAGLTP